MLDAIGNHAQGQSLRGAQRLILRSAVAEDSGQLRSDAVKNASLKLLLKLEEVQEARAKKAKEPPPEAAPVLSEAEKLEALALLKDPRLFERVLEDFEQAGIVMLASRLPSST